MRFEIVTTFKFKFTVFLDVGLCSLVHKY